MVTTNFPYFVTQTHEEKLSNNKQRKMYFHFISYFLVRADITLPIKTNKNIHSRKNTETI